MGLQKKNVLVLILIQATKHPSNITTTACQKPRTSHKDNGREKRVALVSRWARSGVIQRCNLNNIKCQPRLESVGRFESIRVSNESPNISKCVNERIYICQTGSTLTRREPENDGQLHPRNQCGVQQGPGNEPRPKLARDACTRIQEKPKTCKDAPPRTARARII